MKTVLNIKTEQTVKHEAQQVARELGLPLGTIINAYLKDLARERRVMFSAPPAPNKRLQKLLKKVRADKNKKNASAGPFNYDEAIAYLDTL